MEILLLIALVIVGVQSMIIAMLVGLVNKTRRANKAQRNNSRGFVRSLIETATELQSELDNYKSAYNECYAEYKALYKQNKVISSQLEEMNRIHGQIVNNLMICIKEGRIIKSRYLDKVITYRFENMTGEEISQFFGDKIS